MNTKQHAYLMNEQDQLYVQLSRQGFQLLHSRQYSHACPANTLQALLNSQFCVYMINTESEYQIMNEESAHVCNYDSLKNVLGRTIADFTKSSSAETILMNNRRVMEHQKVLILNEDLERLDHYFYQTLSIKFPWINEQGETLGALGCSMVVNMHSLADSLTTLSQFGLLQMVQPLHDLYITKYAATHIHKKLSPQQRKCAEYFVKGETYKTIAAKLDLSPRTVESYILTLKRKYHCRNKAELILLLNELLQQNF